jgi:hypothetical protein
MPTISKYLHDREEWSAADFDHYQRTGELPLDPVWVKRKAEALEDAGLAPDDDVPKSLEEMTSADHERRKYCDRR